MTDDTEEQPLPFVTVASKGGPHDDVSYEAGWQMGQLDAVLGIPHIQAYGMAMFSSNVKQADLIAMFHDFKTEVISDNGEEAIVEFNRICTCEDGHEH